MFFMVWIVFSVATLFLFCHAYFFYRYDKSQDQKDKWRCMRWGWAIPFLFPRKILKLLADYSFPLPSMSLQLRNTRQHCDEWFSVICNLDGGSAGPNWIWFTVGKFDKTKSAQLNSGNFLFIYLFYCYYWELACNNIRLMYIILMNLKSE